MMSSKWMAFMARTLLGGLMVFAMASLYHHQRDTTPFHKTSEKAAHCQKSKPKSKPKKTTPQCAAPHPKPKVRQTLAQIETIKMQHVETHQKLDQSLVDGTRVIVDLSFCADQSERECHSLLKQLGCFYGYLKKCPLDALIALELASFYGSIQQLAQRQGLASWKITRHPQSIDQVIDSARSRSPKPPRVVYLTPDAPKVLQSVDKDCIYVVGGIVDRTVRKNQSLARARSLHVETARLPVQQHIKCRTHVLNVDSVLIILNEVANHGDWKRAFDQAIPKRLEKKKPHVNATNDVNKCKCN